MTLDLHDTIVKIRTTKKVHNSQDFSERDLLLQSRYQICCLTTFLEKHRAAVQSRLAQPTSS